ncbi:zinc metallopeptidase [Sinanaerobacter chloroacetimidivorans]|jgi:Zn-dependent membrane protease YugP|uniref:Zinc metallopeptidase n=1 Tax=Sinanaerobacter chloroacetimidivorans TaxID=2818044 RepID=A0A8J7W3I2_9FIRM|nr:zinc metallopeptidase [Sinanaerobacter chloroacetimidivorans]MBR0600222.1 zinc metallopeptidase [Sinanaerobacter chloroacetimidivorans]
MYYGLFGIFDPTILILIPAMIFAFYAQSKVNSAYNRYARVRNRSGMTGAAAARRILDSNGLQNVPVEISNRRLSDHYDPRKKVLRLSPQVYNEPSIASVSIAAHEAGHAIQHAKSYQPLRIRNAIAPVVSIASNLAWPILIVGLFIIYGGDLVQGNLIFNIGILLYASAVVFQAITLPVEYNASNRAIEQLNRLGIIYLEETESAKKVLSAAALTYVAALAATIASLLRILALRGRN